MACVALWTEGYVAGHGVSLKQDTYLQTTQNPVLNAQGVGGEQSPAGSDGSGDPRVPATALAPGGRGRT